MKKKQRNRGTGADCDHHSLPVLYGGLWHRTYRNRICREYQKQVLIWRAASALHISAKEENPDSEDMKDTVYKMQKRGRTVQHGSSGVSGGKQPYHGRNSRSDRRGPDPE